MKFCLFTEPEPDCWIGYDSNNVYCSYEIESQSEPEPEPYCDLVNSDEVTIIVNEDENENIDADLETGKKYILSAMIENIANTRGTAKSDSFIVDYTQPTIVNIKTSWGDVLNSIYLNSIKSDPDKQSAYIQVQVTFPVTTGSDSSSQ